MIFVISLLLIENLHDNIKQYTPLTMQNMTTWGAIPGSANYSYTKSVHLFDIEDSSTPGNINLTCFGPIGYDVSRTFKDPTYDGARKVINYTMEYDYALDADTPAGRERRKIKTVNLDAEATWYQLNLNRPEFFRAWQAMALVSSTMLESDILSTFYAY